MRVAMFVYDDVVHDARVRREAVTLAQAGHEVTIVGRPTDPRATDVTEDRLDGIRVIRVPIPGGWRPAWRILGAPLRAVAALFGRLRGRRDGGRTLVWLVVWRFAVAGWARAAARRAPRADVAHGHDLSGVLAARRVADRDGARLIFDSHELLLESAGSSVQPAWGRWLLRRVEASMFRRASAVITVNRAIGAELTSRYGVVDPVVVHNCPPRWTPPARPPDLIRAATGIPADDAIALYHGGFSEHRGLEQLGEAILRPGLERVHAVYLGYGRLRPLLEEMTRDPRFGGRVHVLDAVDPADLLPWLASADVGVMAIQASTLNHRLSTPNKLFECLAAGVPVVASDFPDMRRILLDDADAPLGAVCDPLIPDAIAGAIRVILGLAAGARVELRERCLRAARERWNWETEGARLTDLYRSLASPA